jgi:hypothetical protein
MAAGGKDIVIRAAIEGANDVAKSLKDLQGQLDKLAIEGAKAGDPFASIPKAAKQSTEALKQVTTQVGLTRQQALALTYTFNDVTASLASGISPMTILLQQGGQLSQAFNGVSNTVSVLIGQFIKFLPLIATAGAAIAAAFAVIKIPEIGLDAASKLSDIGKAADQAGVSLKELQKLAAAGITVGVSADDSMKFAKEGAERFRDAALSARDAQQSLRDKIYETQELVSKGKASQSDVEKLWDQLKALPDPFSKIGQNLRQYDGSLEQTGRLIDETSLKLQRLQGTSSGLDAKRGFAKATSPDFANVLALGPTAQSRAFNDANRLAQQSSEEDVQRSREIRVNAEKAQAASEQTKLNLEANFLGAAEQKAKSDLQFYIDWKNQIEGISSAATTAGQAVETLYKLRNGDQATRENNPTLTAAYDAITGIGTALSSASQYVVNFASAIQSATASLFDMVRKFFGASSDNSTPKLASGGFVSGPGTSTSDSIPAWLSSGEYVVRASAVKHYGVGLMHAINGMSALPRGLGFASGGLVPPSAAIVGGSSSGRGLTLVLDNKTFGGFSGSSGAMDSLERYAIQRRLSSTTKRTPSRVG